MGRGLYLHKVVPIRSLVLAEHKNERSCSCKEMVQNVPRANYFCRTFEQHYEFGGCKIGVFGAAGEACKL